MRLRNHLGKILFLICHTLTFAEIDHRRLTDDLEVPKRAGNEYPNCPESFEVHRDKLIRTQDSKALGARYLNERDVPSREDCMQLCCSSDNCDVFVFEETKVPGGCYLFECGPPEEFKCKFTKYKNYTSGFLNVNRHLNDLESQIKYSQHERELTKLRESYDKASAPTEVPKPHKTTASPKTKEVLEQYGPETIVTNHQISGRRGCSRNQFECHSTGECIAIYNACDGIPQCSDGSDESPELGCPALQTTISAPVKHIRPSSAPVTIRQQQQELIPETAMGGENANVDREVNIYPVHKQWPTHEEYGLKNQQSSSGTYQQKLPSFSGNQMSGLNLQDVPRVGYGREGEELVNYRGPDPSSNWGSSQYRHNQGSQIFTHKGEGLVPQSNRFQQQQHSYVPPESQVRAGLQYSDSGQGEYPKYYMENGQYNRLYGGQGPVSQSWQPVPKPHNMNIPELTGPQAIDEMSGARNEAPQSGPYPDYYYEELYKNKMQQQQQPPYPVIQPVQYPQQSELPAPPQPKVITQAKEELKPAAHPAAKETQTVQTTSVAPVPAKEAETKVKDESGSSTHDAHAKTSHRKVEKLTADVRLKESLMSLEEEVRNNSPRGAILSLTMGLCITGLMLLLIGCRMRVVSKRMRRGGKGYAHDADFLVNGMYL